MKQVAQLTDWSSKSFFQNEQIQRAQNRFRKWNFRIEKISKQLFSLNVIKPKKMHNLFMKFNLIFNAPEKIDENKISRI